MKKYYLLLFLLIFIPIVHADSMPYGLYNVYLDGKLLHNFTFTELVCYSPYVMNTINTTTFMVFSNNTEWNCTWVLDRGISSCKSNPCMFFHSSNSRFYLETDGKTILTNETGNVTMGQYNMFIASDGGIELNFLKKVKDPHSGVIFFFIILILLPLLLLNAGIESIIAYIYFRIKAVPDRRLWMVLLANTITYVPFMLSISLLNNTLILLAEILIVIVEALFYKWTIKELQWKDVFILSLIANITTVAISLIIKHVWF